MVDKFPHVGDKVSFTRYMSVRGVRDRGDDKDEPRDEVSCK